MKIDITHDFLTREVSVWLVEDQQNGDYATYHIEDSQLIGVVHPKRCNEINENQKAFMRIDAVLFEDIVKAFIDLANKKNIKTENQITYENIIESKNDQIKFSQDMAMILSQLIRNPNP